MHFDFAALLVILTVFTGVVWAVDALVFAPRRRTLAGANGAVVEDEQGSERAGEPLVVEYARSFFPVILIVLIIRSFLGEPFRIPSSSMVPTLLNGDLILVSKFSYGLRLPVTNDKILDLGEPERGDVVVFRYPKDESIDYIKRVVGLPGDVVELRNGQLYINSEKVPLEVIGPYIPPDNDPEERTKTNYAELLDDTEHRLVYERAAPPGSRPLDDRRWVVPERSYFVMGDNRDNSQDSRYWGFVPEENLVGKAILIWMRLSTSNWDRIGTLIE